MVPRGEHPHDDAVVDELQRIGVWKWVACGVALWGIGSVLMVHGSWYSADTVTENITFVAVNTLIGAVLGLLAGWFAVPKAATRPAEAGVTVVSTPAPLARE